MADNSDDDGEGAAHFPVELVDIFMHFADAQLRTHPAMIVDD